MDSNSPAFWADGRLHVFNSLHHPFLSDGRTVARLVDPVGVSFQGGVAGPRWMEAVIQDGGRHALRVLPPRADAACATAYQDGAPDRRRAIAGRRLSLGRPGDHPRRSPQLAEVRHRRTSTSSAVRATSAPSSIQDRDFVYFFFSAYPPRAARPGDRRRPHGVGAIATAPPAAAVQVACRELDGPRAGRAGATPIYGVRRLVARRPTPTPSGGRRCTGTPSSTSYVILMTRTRDSAWCTEGIYVAYADRLEDPCGWSAPQRLIEGGAWYPQVMGLERGRGTDSLAGEYARFFMGGRSDFFIRFALPAAAPAKN